MGICFGKCDKNKLYSKLHKKILDSQLNQSSESLAGFQDDKFKSAKVKLLDNHYQSDLENELG